MQAPSQPASGLSDPRFSAFRLLLLRPRSAAYEEPLVTALRFYACGRLPDDLAEVLRSRRRRRAEVLSMHSCVDFAGDSSWEPWDGLELFEGGVEECFWGAEVGQYLLLALGTDAGEVVQDRGGHGPATDLDVVGVGEAVSLITDALQEM